MEMDHQALESLLTSKVDALQDSFSFTGIPTEDCIDLGRRIVMLMDFPDRHEDRRYGQEQSL